MPTRSKAAPRGRPDPLEAYRAKRDFARTPEPRGTPSGTSNGPLRFVVQKHDASRLHYDLRLELGGVLKSWAVTRGPSLDPADRRLAVQVEDHPLEYGDFEGVIGSGYGAGTVMLWDEGKWELAPGAGGPEEALAQGNLKFQLHGTRLRGGWDLVRMKPRGRERAPQWLLIKRRDEEARPGEGEALVAEETTSVRTGRDMEAIAGVAASGRPGRRRTPRKAATSPKASPRRKAAAEVSVRGVALSSPDKLLWPEEGITKRDLAKYYDAVAERMLRHAGGRALSLVRAPEGIDGPRFFQRHALRGMSSLLRPVRVKGVTKPLLAVEGAGGLVALAQIGVLEIHPWGSRLGDEDRPDRLVFDLDPAEDVPFAEVVETAVELRAVLQGQGLNAFAKTTGGKGMHVVVPLRPRAGWEEARHFAKQLCEGMATDFPGRFTTNMSRQVRTGRIFLDYLRNDRGATAVAPWSPRARPGATIARPVAWEEVGPGRDPKQFTIASVSALLKQPDPWKDFDEASRFLPGRH